MPRKNKTIAHTYYQPSTAGAPLKKRFISEHAAKNAIKELKKYHLDLELSVYRSHDDGGWYLTSK